MSDQTPTPQVSAQQLLKLATGTSFGLATTGAVIGFVGLLLPFVSFSTNLGIGMDQSGSFSGLEAGGWAGWLALVGLVAAAASWKVAQLAPYRLILGGVAVAAALLAIIVAWFFNPASRQMDEINATMSSLGAQGNLVSFGPHIGMLILLIGAGLVGWTALKAR